MTETRTWDELMAEVIGPGFDDVLVLQAGKDPLDMDFDAIQRTAAEMADAMALGHGALVNRDVPGFADMARRQATAGLTFSWATPPRWTGAV